MRTQVGINCSFSLIGKDGQWEQVSRSGRLRIGILDRHSIELLFLNEVELVRSFPIVDIKGGMCSSKQFYCVHDFPSLVIAETVPSGIQKYALEMSCTDVSSKRAFYSIIEFIEQNWTCKQRFIREVDNTSTEMPFPKSSEDSLIDYMLTLLPQPSFKQLVAKLSK